MTSEKKSGIYIATNQSFKQELIKIGYSDDIDKRIIELSNTSVPYPYRLYAWYESTKLADKKIQELIDLLDEDARCNPKREFYKIEKETVYRILELISQVNGCEGKLHLVEDENNFSEDEREAVDETQYKKDVYLSNKNEDVIKIYNEFLSEITNVVPELYVEATPQYIALRFKDGDKKRNVCELHLMKEELQIITKEPKLDELKIGENVPETHKWTLNYRIYIGKNDQNLSEKIRKAVEIVVETYNKVK